MKIAFRAKSRLTKRDGPPLNVPVAIANRRLIEQLEWKRATHVCGAHISGAVKQVACRVDEEDRS
jgi:hypothetical protein